MAAAEDSAARDLERGIATVLCAIMVIVVLQRSVLEVDFKGLTDQIVAQHHSFLRRELPVVSNLLIEMEGQDGASEQLSEARNLFTKVRNKVEAHLRDEETVLFPAGVALESGEPLPTCEFDLLERLTEMEKEHENCGKALLLLVQMLSAMPVSDLQAKSIASVKAICADLDVHVDKENSQVHPRFLELMSTVSRTG